MAFKHHTYITFDHPLYPAFVIFAFLVTCTCIHYIYRMATTKASRVSFSNPANNKTAPYCITSPAQWPTEKSREATTKSRAVFRHRSQ